MTDTTHITMSVRQIEAALNAEDARLDRADTNLKTVQARTPDTVDGPDSEAVRAVLAAEYEPVLVAAEDAAESAAGVALANLDQVLMQTEAGGLTLTAEEYAVANSRREDIRDDVEHLPYRDLIRQVRYALTVDDRAALALYARFGPRRLSDTDGSWAGSGSEAEKEDLRRMLREIDGRLSDTSLKPLNDRAVALRSRAYKTQNAATRRKAAQQKYRFQSENEVPFV